MTTKAKSDPKVRMVSKLTKINGDIDSLCVCFKKKVEPWKLYSMVTGLLVVDFVILLAWQLQDPLQRRVELFPYEDPISAADDSKILPELEHCESSNNIVWLGVVYGYKGLILVSILHANICSLIIRTINYLVNPFAVDNAKGVFTN